MPKHLLYSTYVFLAVTRKEEVAAIKSKFPTKIPVRYLNLILPKVINLTKTIS